MLGYDCPTETPDSLLVGPVVAQRQRFGVSKNKKQKNKNFYSARKGHIKLIKTDKDFCIVIKVNAILLHFLFIKDSFHKNIRQ